MFNKIYTQKHKVLTLCLGLMMVCVMAIPITPARAQTVSELQAQINQLLQQIATLQTQLGSDGGALSNATVCPFVWTRSLGVGSTGSDVYALQRFLNGSADTRLAMTGAGSPGQETQYYGPITANAVSRFQAKYRAEVLTPLGLVSPTGYFGPSSRSKANTLCATIVTPPGDDGNVDEDLSGGAGSISEAEWISNLNNEEVGEDQEDVEVAGLEIEAGGSDIEIQAVRLDFTNQETISGSSDDFEDYADEVSVWFDGDEVARVDADEFTDDNNYSQSITIDANSIIREDEVGELIVAVSGINNLDSDDEGEEWTVEFDSVRFRDAQNAFISETNAGDIGETRSFTFEEFAAAQGLELHITSGDDSINDAQTIAVDENDETDDVEVFAFDVEVEGDSDVTVEDLVIEATTGGATNIGEMAVSAQLELDGDNVGSENLSSDNTITFDNIDVELEAGETYEFVLLLDFRALDDDLDEGDTVSFNISSTERDAWEVEDETGDDVDDSDKTGAASTETHVVYSTGLGFSLVSTNANVTITGDPSVPTSDQGTFKIVYDLTAFGDDVTIDQDCTEAQADVADQGVEFTITNAGSNTTSCIVSSTADDNPSDSNAWIVEEGETERFTLTVVATATADHFARVYLTSLNWDNDTSDDSPDLFFTSGLGQNTATDSIFLNNN